MNNPKSQRFPIKTLLPLLLAVLLTLPACAWIDTSVNKIGIFMGGATPLPVDPSAELLKFSDDQIKIAIQSVVNNYAKAYNTNNMELLQKITDSENLPFKRLVSNRFTSDQESIYGGSINMRLTVDSIERMPLGFVQAHILTDWNSAADWTFRMINKEWVLSEPSEAQFGEPYTKETEHFTYELYHWSDEINGEIIDLMENAAERVLNKLGKLPSDKAEVIILPGYSADQFSDPNALAYYQTALPGELDSITLFTPNSYSFGWYDVTQGWEKSLEDTLTHEYTHMTHQRAFNKAGRLMDWFSEGLAEFVSDSPRYLEIAGALNPDRLIPIVDSQSTINQQDLNHIYLLDKDVSLAYAEAESLIMYIHDTYGGMDAVWNFAQAHDDLQNMDEAMQKAFGVDYATFDSQWRDWLVNTLFKN
jgi:hypothetical protein